MGNTSVQRVCLDTVATYLASNLGISALAGKVTATGANPHTLLQVPAIKVMSGKFTFEAADYQEVYENAVSDDGKVIVDVGQFTGFFTLELFASSKFDRETYEQKVIDLFLSSSWSPGTLYLQTPNLLVNGYTSLYSADFKIFLQDSEWMEEFGFEGQRNSFIDVYVDFPALTTYDAVNLTSLQVCLAGVSDNIVTIADISLNDRVEVLVDGTTTKGTL